MLVENRVLKKKKTANRNISLRKPKKKSIQKHGQIRRTDIQMPLSPENMKYTET